MIPRLPVVCALLLLAGCATRQTVTMTPAPLKHPVREAMDRQVRNAADAGDGDLELAALRQAVASNPRNKAARIDLASRYVRMGFPDLALEHFRLAAALFPDDASLRVDLAREFRRSGMAVAGARMIDEFLSTREGTAELHSWAGILHDEAGELAVGESSHRRAIQLADGAEDYLHNNLGYNLLLQGRSDEASREFRRALEIAPRSEVARNNLGTALSGEAGHENEAVMYWRSVMGPASAHNNLAAVHIEQGRYQEARKELNISLGYRPDNPAALHNLALVSQLDGKPAILPVKRPASGLKKLGWLFRKDRVADEPKIAARRRQ